MVRTTRLQQHRVNPGNCSGVNDDLRPLHRPTRRVIIQDVALHEHHIPMLDEVPVLKHIPNQIIKLDDIIVIGQAAGQRRADKPRATGNHNTFLFNSHLICPSFDSGIRSHV